MKTVFKIFLLVGIFFLSGASNPPGEDKSFSAIPDYKTVFGDNYSEALNFVSNRPDLTIFFAQQQIQPDFAWAIVFPELIRYSSLCDKIELASLYTLYIAFGENYANFSVGNFQMKPSFAQQIESDYLKLKNRLSVKGDYSFDTSNTRQARAERIKRLNDIQWQATYLSIFIKLLDFKYAGKTWESKSEKLKIYATAYNSGYWLSQKELIKRMDQKLFYTSIIPVSEEKKYAYSFISEDYFLKSGN